VSSRELPPPVRRAYRAFRLPEYTGENRCIPCTVTNLCLLTVGVVLLGLLWPAAAGGLLVVGIAAIWLRGYLVPGTPTLTEQYFPDRLLALFDKEPETAGGEAAGSTDAEAVLSNAGVVVPCRDGADLRLDGTFAEAWHDRIATLRDDDVRREALGGLLGADPTALSIERYGDASVVSHDGRRVGQWASDAALLSDLAAAELLPRWVDDWGALSVAARSELLNGLRVFLERCPDCDGQVEMRAETVESCCRSHEVVATECVDCSARLLEVATDTTSA
jgi:hypothetical protein